MIKEKSNKNCDTKNQVEKQIPLSWNIRLVLTACIPKHSIKRCIQICHPCLCTLQHCKSMPLRCHRICIISQLYILYTFQTLWSLTMHEVKIDWLILRAIPKYTSTKISWNKHQQLHLLFEQVRQSYTYNSETLHLQSEMKIGYPCMPWVYVICFLAYKDAIIYYMRF